MSSLEKYFNRRYHYPIVIFHEKDKLMDAARRSISSNAAGPVFFQIVSFELPSFINSSRLQQAPCGRSINYRHMCRFHARDVYYQPILSGVDYAWRLDDDAILLDDVMYDVFGFMKERDLVYGYRLIVRDGMDCIYGLWPATKEYIKNNSIVVEFFADWPIKHVFYNNFEVSALSFWRSPAYQNYIEYVDSLGGIFYYRWGDAPIKTLALSMFVPLNKTHAFLNIPYRHKENDLGIVLV
jgi:hypothetical protein